MKEKYELVCSDMFSSISFPFDAMARLLEPSRKAYFLISTQKTHVAGLDIVYEQVDCYYERKV